MPRLTCWLLHPIRTYRVWRSVRQSLDALERSIWHPRHFGPDGTRRRTLNNVSPKKHES